VLTLETNQTMKNHPHKIIALCLVLVAIGFWQLCAWDARNTKTEPYERRISGEVVDVDVKDSDSSTGYVWTIRLNGTGARVKYHGDKIGIGSRVDVVFRGYYQRSPLINGYHVERMEAFFVPES
jgi:hypothetical protein